jgi:hypothetical protein
MVGRRADFQMSLQPADVVAGDANAAAAALRKARALWARAKRGEAIGELIERAEVMAKGRYTQSGLENALRVEFRTLARNKRKLMQFNPEEREAIKRVAEGAPFTNAMRFLGKYAPTSALNFATGPGLAGAAGFAVGGPALGAAAAATAAAGAGTARALATSGTRRAAREAQALALRGYGLPRRRARPRARPRSRPASRPLGKPARTSGHGVCARRRPGRGTGLRSKALSLRL